MNEFREDFPMLKKDYIYFNSASTAYKPKAVIDKIVEYYENYSVNTNRGISSLGYEVTEKYENARKVVADFIGSDANEIIFTRGTTESINLAARFIENTVNADDEIIVSVHEHHSNFVPWQELCIRKNAKLIIVKTDENGMIDLKDLEEKLNSKTKVVAINHTSNVFGSTNPLKEIAEIVHRYNAFLAVDGAQGIVHNKVNVKDSNVDFYSFSGHKIYGPMGVGVLYGRGKLLKTFKPVMFGGEMIDIVSLDNTTYKEIPYCFEAGTMMIPEVLALATAIEYIKSIGHERINAYVRELRKYLVYKLKAEVNDIEIYNEKIAESPFVTFNIKNIHAHDVATYLDRKKIIVRAGHHCAQPLADYLNVPSTIRVSLAFYNNKEECDRLVEELKKVGEYINVLF